jgi:multidrug efflux pump subunit AcrA (membrane-fusion protein)
VNEEKKEKNKKEKIKSLAILFLVVMLLLTFFSNTIMNYSLPEVSTAYAESGTVTSKVRGSGTVEAAEDYEVKVTENHVVGSVKVKVGDEVEEGDLLFVLDGSGAAADDTALKEAQETLDSLELDYNKALLSAAPSYALDNLEIQSAREELSTALSDQTRAAGRAELSEKVNKAKTTVDSLQADVDDLQLRLESVSGNSVTKLSKQLKEKKKSLAEATETYNTLQADLDATPNVSDANEAVREKQKALDTLILTLADKQAEDKVTQGQSALDLQAAKKKVEDQRALVEKLQNGGEESEITAKNAGVVTAVNCIAGDTVTADAPLATIAVTGNGYSLSFTVTKEQSRLVSVGQTAEIQNVWGTDMTAELTSIKADLDNPNKNMVLNFQIKGDDTVVGQSLTLSIGEKSAPYDVTVPNSAIREDNNGKFVLVVNVKSSPLGNRYVLSRADVEVLASDDTNSAVSGGLYGYEYVVTNATKPLESGMKVRLAE